MFITRKRIPWLFFAFVLAFTIFTAIPSQAAHAQVPDGSDPYADGCAGGNANYYVVETSNIYNGGQFLGYVQLWYSGTCNTNWGRVVPANASSALNISLEAYNYSAQSWQIKQDTRVCNPYCWDGATSSYDFRTGQYDIPGPASTYACVFPAGNAPGGCSAASQPI
ncbi:MAG TPA: DUF2690 domain-containing protein [Ktedonosporobacter sp.]|jgi:hypothetical protein|nr:DUF2690 domain-containing protein [Ktedonosporobacter sp.]